MEAKALEQMQKCYAQRDLAARQWREKGGRVAGYFCNSVPEELLAAAGFLPFRLSGDPWSGTETADRYSEPFFQPDVRSMLNMLLTGRYDFLNFLIIPHSSDAVSSLYEFLSRIREMDPALKLPEIYLYDTLHTGFYTSDGYSRSMLHSLKRQLEEWAGREIDPERLAGAITAGNENREMLGKISGLRTAWPPRLSGVTALQIFGSAVMMPREEHNRLLQQFLSTAERLPERNGARLFVSGSPLDNTQFYELVESCQATVVAEDNCWGNIYAGGIIHRYSSAVEAIADRYISHSTCPRTFSLEQKKQYLLHSAAAAGAQGVVFFFLEWDSAPAWEYPDLKKALENEGLKTVCFEMQKYLLAGPERETIKINLERFISELGSTIA